MCVPLSFQCVLPLSFPHLVNLSFPHLMRESPYDNRLSGQDETMTECVKIDNAKKSGNDTLVKIVVSNTTTQRIVFFLPTLVFPGFRPIFALKCRTQRQHLNLPLSLSLESKLCRNLLFLMPVDLHQVLPNQ